MRVLMRRWLRRYPISSVLLLSVLLHLLIGWLIVVPFNFMTENHLVEQPAIAVPMQIKLIEMPPAVAAPTQAVPVSPPPIPARAAPPSTPQLSLKSADDPTVTAAQAVPTEPTAAADAVLDDFEFDLDAPEPYYPPPIDAWDRDLTERDWLSFENADTAPTTERVLTEQFARGVFPQQIKSVYQGEVIGIDFELQQTWTLDEQQHYQIVTEAEKFGFKVQATSSGQVTASGLLPSQFEILINQNRHAWAGFDAINQVINYGAPTTQSVGWVSGAQDLNSVFFQLALLQQSIADRQVQVAAVNQVYAVDLKHTERRPTRLPTGVLLTDVLVANDVQGQFSGEARFAPALGNYPVAIRVKYGRFDVKLSLQRLEMEGVTVWGR
ncbi:MAG: hypothetical protein WA154_12450 [Moraxellaceae bacterium]